ALETAYSFLYRGDNLSSGNTKSGSGALSIYCHPAHLGLATPYAEQAAALVDDLTLAGSAVGAGLAKDAPAWVLSGQRVLEEAVANYAEPLIEEEPGSPLREGVEEALRFASEAIRECSVESGRRPAVDAEVGRYANSQESGREPGREREAGR